MPVDYPHRSPAFLQLRVAVRPFVSPEPVTIGLSGGADSLALVAAALVEGQAVHAVVVDHQLQAGSVGVAKQAAMQARAWGADATVIPVTVSQEGSMEAAARAARYEALIACGRPVWTGHTMDDQAETYLLGALRGNPAGMLPHSKYGEADIVRPLLSVRRATTRATCAELGVTPWEDPHNDSEAFRRVAVRKQVMPLLDAINGGPAVPGVAQAAYRVALQHDFVQQAARATTSIAELASMHPAVRHASIAGLIRDADCPIKYATVVAVEQLVTQWHGQGPVAIGGGRSIRRHGSELRVD
ncbi:tRNA(Ile)-lysidine synthase [Corynebacterium kalinowskii]|uniref:tRNA(Ile)-lysidine synthase n=1 Tax=Corynebacterium kalinowskii TaxID=2675216 RepID=A0A6B8V818_9CORY|nr:tRNA lysidine(34) synthetase TilS [Corynebacterium kalinowskii]QGU01252.1 tRNA(Ile)-lysidine synthase [Corynebacterium kalinowskii]